MIRFGIAGCVQADENWNFDIRRGEWEIEQDTKDLRIVKDEEERKELLEELSNLNECLTALKILYNRVEREDF